MFEHQFQMLYTMSLKTAKPKKEIFLLFDIEKNQQLWQVWLLINYASQQY